MIKGIIFDIDGVIINNESHYFETYKMVLGKRGYDLEREEYNKYFSGKSITGALLSFQERVNSEDLPARLDLAKRAGKAGLIVNSNFDEIIKEIYDYSIRFFGNNLVFCEDTLNFINKVKGGGIKLKRIGLVTENPLIAVATGLSRGAVLEILSYHKLSEMIKFIVSVEDYSKSKPDPACYQKALEKMNLQPDEVFGIEDTPAGIAALKGAGIFAVGITNTHSREDLRQADLVVESLMELV